MVNLVFDCGRIVTCYYCSQIFVVTFITAAVLIGVSSNAGNDDDLNSKSLYHLHQFLTAPSTDDNDGISTASEQIW